MSRHWNEYLALLEESAGLAEQEDRGVAVAQSAYDAEARRLQNQLALADREFTSLKGRNTRLQVGVRDVVRALGVSQPASSTLPALSASQLGDAMKAAEYDLTQIRRSLEYLRVQQQTPARAPATAPPAYERAPVPSPQPAPPTAEEKSSHGMALLIAAGIVLVLLIIIGVIVL